MKQRGVLGGAFLALALFAVAPARGATPAPERYLLPDWYAARVTPEVRGGTVFVRAQLEPYLAPMRKVRVRLETSRGLRLISTQFSPASSKSGAPASSEFEGTLETGTKLVLNAIAEREPGLDRAFVTLAFDYDYPADEILGQITRHASDRYPNAALRLRLEQAIRKSHTGRKSERVTERIDFGAGR